MARLKTKRSVSSKSNGKGEVSKLIRKTRQATRKRYSACGRVVSAEKIRIVMEGVRGDEPVSTICRREGIHSNLYYRWLKGDEQRGATRGEVQELQQENERLKQLVAELSLGNMVLRKSLM